MKQFNKISNYSYVQTFLTQISEFHFILKFYNAIYIIEWIIKADSVVWNGTESMYG